MLNKNSKKAFTLIELIVVMAVIGIIVLLAIPKFMGHTKEAKFTKLISDTKVLEDASERYYMDNQDWPRLSDIPYNADQINAFAQKVYDRTGHVVTLDPAGNYYDISYEKLSKYVNVPDDKLNYIIQNPVGNVYALDGLSPDAQKRITSIKATAITLDKDTLTLNIGDTQKLTATIQPNNATNSNLRWESNDTSVATVDANGSVTGIKSGSAIITVSSWDKGVIANCNVSVNILFTSQIFNYTGNYQVFDVPVTGKYRIEAWGASSGEAYVRSTRIEPGLGGYVAGEVQLTAGQALYVYIGGAGSSTLGDKGGWNGGGSGDLVSGISVVKGASGGGATDIRTISGAWNNITSLQSRIIVAGGGGGSTVRKGGDGGGLIATYDSFYKTNASGGTQTSGGIAGEFSWAGSAPTNGSLGVGGNGSSEYGGGGGGGYYGGGGAGVVSGEEGVGGGGSSYYGTLSNASTTSGINEGNGKAVITYLD